MDNPTPSIPSPSPPSSTQQLRLQLQQTSLFAFSNNQQEAVQLPSPSPSPLTPPATSFEGITYNSPTQQPLQVIALNPNSTASNTPINTNNNNSPNSSPNNEKGKTYVRRRGRPPLDKSSRVCTSCGTTNTGEWRRGELGPHTLCNACGLQYLKEKKREKQVAQLMQEATEESARANINNNNNDNNTEASNNNSNNNTNSTSFPTLQHFFIPSSPAIKAELDYNNITAPPTQQSTSSVGNTAPFLPTPHTPLVNFPQSKEEYDAVFELYFQRKQQLLQLQQLQEQHSRLQQLPHQQTPQQQQAEDEMQQWLQNMRQAALQQLHAQLNTLLQQQLLLQQQQHILQQQIQQHLTLPPTPVSPTPVTPTPLQLQLIQQLQEEQDRNAMFLQHLYQYFNIPPPRK